MTQGWLVRLGLAGRGTGVQGGKGWNVLFPEKKATGRESSSPLMMSLLRLMTSSLNHQEDKANAKDSKAQRSRETGS